MSKTEKIRKVLRNCGYSEEAIEEIQRVLELDPDNALLLQNLKQLQQSTQ